MYAPPHVFYPSVDPHGYRTGLSPGLASLHAQDCHFATHDCCVSVCVSLSVFPLFSLLPKRSLLSGV